MAEGHYPEDEAEDKRHRLKIWEEFCERAVDAGNRAIEFFELGDVEDEYGDAELNEIYLARWESSGVIVEAAYNFIWPEIESLAIKLGVPFIPEINEIID